MEAAKQEIGSETGVGQEWIGKELAAVKLPDARLDKRPRSLMEKMSKGVGRSIPWACQDWAATKAAYRFFSNGRVGEEQILAGHFQATRERAGCVQEPVLVVHDTTEFSYRRKATAAVGVVSKRLAGKDNHGKPVYFTTRGINLHSSLAITQAVEKVQWYALRWKIEVFHKILKSGCRAEHVRLRTAPRLINLLTVFCILSWRIFWLTMMNRIAPEANRDGVFTNLELRILDRLVNNNSTVHRGRRKLSHYLIKLARLGGYLARNGDPPPGNETIWRGLTRLIDIQLGVIIGAGFVGN